MGYSFWATNITGQMVAKKTTHIILLYINLWLTNFEWLVVIAFFKCARFINKPNCYGIIALRNDCIYKPLVCEWRTLNSFSIFRIGIIWNMISYMTDPGFSLVYWDQYIDIVIWEAWLFKATSTSMHFNYVLDQER